MAPITAGFETGVSGNTIATGDAGNATAWDTVTTGAGTITYDNTHAFEGTLASKFTTTTAAAPVLVWVAAFGTQTDHYGLCYLYCAANPPTATRFVEWRSGASLAATLRLNADGTISWLNSAASVKATSTNSISLNQWVRIEWHAIHSTTVGTVEFKIFNTPTSGTATETVTTAANSNTLASADRVRFGVSTGSANQSYWIDSISENGAAYLAIGTLAKTETNDTSAGSGSSVTGTLTKTEGNDTSAAAGGYGPSGSLAKTEANDTSSAAGSSTAGTLAKTEVNDTLSGTGGYGPNGTLARAETNDSVAAAGGYGPSGTLARTETNDTLAASGGYGPSGSLARSEQDDTSAGAGSEVVGSLTRTEQPDTSVATGTAYISIIGTAACIEGDDTCSAVGTSGAASITSTQAVGSGISGRRGSYLTPVTINIERDDEELLLLIG